MIWIIGEYAERIDNAAELLESFLEGFQDENTQVLWIRIRIFLQNSKSLNILFRLKIHYCVNFNPTFPKNEQIANTLKVHKKVNTSR